MPSDLDVILALDEHDRSVFVQALPSGRRDRLLADLENLELTERYQDDPVGFINNELHEAIWGKQAAVCESVRDYERTAVPACHAPGKTHLAARIVSWWIRCHPVGTAQAVTTANTFRQVRNLLWPHIRRLHERHDLPGRTNLVEWWIGEELCAYGFSAADQDPEAVQGIHAPYLLIIVDEGAGITEALGEAIESLLTTGLDADTPFVVRVLVLGNPPVDNEDTWFEHICTDGMLIEERDKQGSLLSSSGRWNVVRIAAEDTPNWTGEETQICGTCPSNIPEHRIAAHLLSRRWVEEAIEDHGEDSAFVIAKVKADFPKGVGNKAIPWARLEESSTNDQDYLDSDVIQLGVDVAADGGDEMAVAEADGYRIRIIDHQVGAINENAVDVAGVVLRHVQEAERKHAERGVTVPVRVKIDAIGVGWGVASILKKWKQEGLHRAEIVAVNVGESFSPAQRKADPKGREDKPDFLNLRAELWWNGREEFAPRQLIDDETGMTITSYAYHLDVDRKTLAQLNGPTYGTSSSGKLTIERKVDMKKRGVPSPDRAEAVLLALYEPPEKKKRKVRVIV